MFMGLVHGDVRKGKDVDPSEFKGRRATKLTMFRLIVVRQM